MRVAAKLRGLFSDTQTVSDGEAAGLKMVVRGADPEFARGTYELPIQRAIAAALKEGDVFYDIGANIGFFSLLAARRVGAGGQVYSFEPVARNAAAVARSAELNGFSGTLDVFCEAVGATTGRAELLLAHHIGGAALASADAPPDMSGRQVVDVTTLDDAIARRGLRPPSLVKIDVEGAEIDVLRGMTETLRTHRPAVIYEIDDANREGIDRKAGEIEPFLVSAGYALEKLPAAYAMDNWQVVHALARPAPS